MLIVMGNNWLAIVEVQEKVEDHNEPSKQYAEAARI